MKKVSQLISLLTAMAATTLATLPAFAQEHAAGGGAGTGSGLIGIGAGLAVSLAAMGAGLGQGKAVASAMDGISRNPAAQPKMFVALIIGLAFMETLVIFSFVIAIMLQGKV